MTWARGQYRQGKHGPVYLREIDDVNHMPAVMVAGGFLTVIVALLVIVASDAITIAGEHETTLVLVGVPVVAILLVLSIYVLQQRSDRDRLVRSAYRACAVETPSTESLAELASLRESAEPLSEDLLHDLERAYEQLIHVIVADGIAEEHELERLEATEKALKLPADRIEHGRLQGFLDVYDRAVEDGILTDEEQASITHIREALEVPDRLVRRELTFAKQLRRAHEVREEKLWPIRIGLRLHSDEQAYYTSMSTEKKRVARSYQRGADSRREYVFESLRSGNLFVTDQRLIFEAGSTASIPLDRIVEVGVEANSKFLMVHERGRKKTHYYDVPQPYMTMVYIERMLADAATADAETAPSSGSGSESESETEMTDPTATAEAESGAATADTESG